MGVGDFSEKSFKLLKKRSSKNFSREGAANLGSVPGGRQPSYATENIS